MGQTVPSIKPNNFEVGILFLQWPVRILRVPEHLTNEGFTQSVNVRDCHISSPELYR